MFSLDKNKNSIPVVIIRDKNDNVLDGSIIYMKNQEDDDDSAEQKKKGAKKKKIRFADYDEYDDDEIKSEEGEDSFNIDSGKFELLPNTIERQRHNIYVCGRSGSGKSTWCRNYIKNYLKMKKGNSVYIFSALESDDAFDDLKVNRIILDEDIVENPIDPDELRDSLVIYDDIDSLSDPK